MQDKFLITFETCVKEKKSTKSDVRANLDELVNYLNKHLTESNFFDTVRVVNIQTEGEHNDDRRFQRKFDF